MNIICLIPARKNSTRIKNKNLKKIKKKSLVSIACEVASKCQFFSKIILSSDSKKILDSSKKFKNIEAILRPKKFSKKNTNMASLVKHILDKLNKDKKCYPEAIAIMQPTSPLRKINTINKACLKFIRLKPDALITIKKVKHSETPNMIFEINKKKKFQKLNLKINSNKKNYFVLDGGVLFLFKIKNNNRYILDGKTICQEVKFPENIDIDNYNDLKLARMYA
ncbi:hypothetical protein OAL31_00745 [Candidatus Pelagibacter sp.]|nr:hypothetical protein [Candidatus Pelagibacter sp.]